MRAGPGGIVGKHAGRLVVDDAVVGIVGGGAEMEDVASYSTLLFDVIEDRAPAVAVARLRICGLSRF